MAARGSFQKHQKEIARREKREQKLARRQGRAHGPQPAAGAETTEESPTPAEPEQKENHAQS